MDGSSASGLGIAEEGSSRDWITCRYPRFGGGGVRLFCFHHAGGSAAAFRDWPSALPEWVETCVVQLPGRHTLFTHPRHTRIDSLVAALLPGLRPWLDRPFAFFGHSLGSLVAFATAHGLAREGGPLPEHLILSGCRPAHLPRKRPPLAEAPEEALLKAVRTLQPASMEILEDPELRELFLPILRDDFAISESWRWDEARPVTCPISAFGGADDPWVEPEVLADWAALTTSRFAQRIFPGDHFFIEQSRDAVLKAIREALA